MDARHGNKDLQDFLGWSGGQSGGGLRQNLTLMSIWLMQQQIFFGDILNTVRVG